MLGNWRSHNDYRTFVLSRLANCSNKSAIEEFLNIIAKLFIFNLDPLRDIISGSFSHTGRPANFQPEMLRICILMEYLKVPVYKWVSKLEKNFVLRTACGLTRSEVPCIGALYDFIYRIAGKEWRSGVKKFKRKPKMKYKQGEKFPLKRPNITMMIKEKLLIGRRFKDPVAESVNSVLSLAVRQSYELGLINYYVNVSGDGTCMETGASHYGKKICGCKSMGIYNCDCARKFSDPSADWGWDSHNERMFYGYTGYFLTTCEKTHNIDLPLYLRIVNAKRHDSVCALVALSEFSDRYPQLCLDAFISDSASDNQATYQLLDEWGVDAVIALGKSNNGNNRYLSPIGFDNGTPICPSGFKMSFWGDCGRNRPRLKWRCPRATGLVCDKGDSCDSCSHSPYGRVVYTKTEWDPRIFTRIPRDSERWKSIMNERSASERVNNRILNDYGVGSTRRRSKNLIAFDTLIAAINIHLDAQLKVLKAEYDSRQSA